MSSSNKPSAKTPAPVRPAASLLLLTPTNRLLLIHRPTTSSSFPNAHVFPGGVLAPSDSHNRRLAALRETFEETGLLLTKSRPPPHITPQTISENQRRIHSGEIVFQDWVKAFGGELIDDESLRSFTTWTTPPTLPKRWSSSMFLARLPHWLPESEAEEIVKGGDGGIEVTDARFFEIPDLLAKVDKEEVVLFPPQLYLTTKLSECLQEGYEKEEVERRLDALCNEIGEYQMMPRPVKDLGDGKVVMWGGPTGDRDYVVVLQLAGKKEPRGVMVDRAEKYVSESDRKGSRL